MTAFWLKFRVWFGFELGVYRIWSWFIQLFERRAILPKFGSVDDVSLLMSRLIYCKDPWWMLWDAMSSPEAVYRRFLERKPVGDCEDFAILAAHLIEDLRLRGVDGRIQEVGVLMVNWLEEGEEAKHWEKWDEAHGHAVCIFRYRDTDSGAHFWAHVGNWYKGAVRWGYHSLVEIAREIAKDGRLVSFFYLDLELKVRQYLWVK